jgi:hypothetical protein
VVGGFSDKPHAVRCFLKIPCPLGLVGCGATLCVILPYGYVRRIRPYESFNSRLRDRRKSPQFQVPRLRRFFIDEEFHDAGSKGKGRLIETRNRKRERRKDKQTRN